MVEIVISSGNLVFGEMSVRQSANCPCRSVGGPFPASWGYDKSLVLKRVEITITKACVSALAIVLALPPCASAAQSSLSPETTIWFDTAATNFTEYTPLGSGRLGAMMFGGPNAEKIVLNES